MLFLFLCTRLCLVVVVIVVVDVVVVTDGDIVDSWDER